jgi:hypothetical protein
MEVADAEAIIQAADQVRGIGSGDFRNYSGDPLLRTSIPPRLGTRSSN